MSILIITDPYDAQTRLVTQALIQKKVIPIRWFPQNRTSHQMGSFYLGDNEQPNFHLAAFEDLDLSEVQVVWDRSPLLYRQHSEHPTSDNAFISAEQKKFLHALHQMLSHQAAWINSIQSQNCLNNKAIPLIAAAKIGLKTPETLFSNNRSCILKFLNKHQETNVLYKTYSAPCWVKDKIIYRIKPICISKKMLAKQSVLQLSPGIYQQKINTAEHLLVLMFENQTHAFSIKNMHHISWDDMRRYPELTVETTTLPKALHDSCQQLRKNLGLTVASCHFMMSPNDEPVFISMHDNPTFLWLEKHYPEYPLLDFFCEFMMKQRNVNTAPQQNSSVIRLTEMLASHAYQTLLLRDQCIAYPPKRA